MNNVNIFIIEGNYSLVTGEGKMNQVGTIPSELGQLTLWKHVVFGKVMINLLSLFLLVISYACSQTYNQIKHIKKFSE